MATHSTFGDYIRFLRDKEQLGLREAARGLGISASYLSRLEANDYPPPSGEKLRTMARFYGGDIDEMMRLAQDRVHEVMAADKRVAPVVQAFYRLAQDQSPEMQEKMLSAAIEAVDLPPALKQKVMAQLKAALSRTNGRDLPRRARGKDELFAFDIVPRILSAKQISAFAKRILELVFGSEIPIPVPVETIIRKFGPEIVLIIDGKIEGGRLRDGSPAVLGLSRWSLDGDRRELVIHEDLFESDRKSARRRTSFTLAHELFHCLEHLPLVQDRSAEAALARDVALVSFAPKLLAQRWFKRKRTAKKLSTNEDWREWQANAFAASLLMPEHCVRDAFQEFVGEPYLIAEKNEPIEEFADAVARASWTDDFLESSSLVDRFDVNPQAMAIRLLSLDLVRKE